MYITRQRYMYIKIFEVQHHLAAKTPILATTLPGDSTGKSYAVNKCQERNPGYLNGSSFQKQKLLIFVQTPTR